MPTLFKITYNLLIRWSDIVVINYFYQYKSIFFTWVNSVKLWKYEPGFISFENQSWNGCTLFPALEKQRQVYLSEFKYIMVYITNSITGLQIETLLSTALIFPMSKKQNTFYSLERHKWISSHMQVHHCVLFQGVKWPFLPSAVTGHSHSAQTYIQIKIHTHKMKVYI